MFTSRFMPCEDCGASVERSAVLEHRCSDEQRLDYQMFGMRAEIAGFEERLRRFLGSNLGRFETWLAARQVQR